jgi:acyl-CoA synthetase (AMP-forming)/AMP-acid ligase II
MNIVDPILYQCKLNRLTTAVNAPGSILGSISYGALEALVHNVSYAAQRDGIEPGHVAAIYCNDPILHLALTLGVMRIGAISLSLSEPKLPAGLTADIVLTETPLNIHGAARVTAIEKAWFAGDGKPGPITTHRGNDEIGRIILSSDRAGGGLALSHRLLAARIASWQQSKGPRFAHCARFYSGLGLADASGFLYSMALLCRGGTLFQMSRDPADLLQSFALFKVTGAAIPAAALANYLSPFDDDAALDINFEHLICEGAMPSLELSRRARARICQNLYASYAPPETGPVAFAPASLLAQQPGAVGYVLPGVIIEAVDGAGRILPSGKVGHLRIRSDHIPQGYTSDAGQSESRLKEGYVYVADIGHVTPEGILVIVGRETGSDSSSGDQR